MSSPSPTSPRISGPAARHRRSPPLLAGLLAWSLAFPAAHATPPDTEPEPPVEVVPEGDPNAGVKILRGLPDEEPVEDTPPRTGDELERAARAGGLTPTELEALAERTDVRSARLRATHYALRGDDSGLIDALEAWHRADAADPEPPFKLALLAETQGDAEATVRWADVALQRSERFPDRARQRQTLMLAAVAARAAKRQGKPDLARVYAKRYVSVALSEKSRVPEDIRDLALDEGLKPPTP